VTGGIGSPVLGSTLGMAIPLPVPMTLLGAIWLGMLGKPLPIVVGFGMKLVFADAGGRIIATATKPTFPSSSSTFTKELSGLTTRIMVPAGSKNSAVELSEGRCRKNGVEFTAVVTYAPAFNALGDVRALGEPRLPPGAPSGLNSSFIDDPEPPQLARKEQDNTIDTKAGIFIVLDSLEILQRCQVELSIIDDMNLTSRLLH
jgi:hypothetical protein